MGRRLRLDDVSCILGGGNLRYFLIRKALGETRAATR